MTNRNRAVDKIRGIISGRDRHVVVEKIIKFARESYPNWKLAAESQIMAIYRMGRKNARAIVSEMS